MDKTNRPYNGIYDDIEYCRKEILLARVIFGNKNTTREQYEAMEKGLALIFLYCPEELTIIAQATLNEATYRQSFFEDLWQVEESK